MKKFFIRIVTVTLTLFTFNYFCCIDIDYDYYNIYFTNNSNKGVVLAATVDYPDTMPRFDELYGAEVDFKYRYVPANSSTDSALYNTDFGSHLLDNIYYIYNKGYNDTISFFIIDEDVWHEYGPLKIVVYNKVLQRYDLSKKDMMYLEDRLTYPPSPKMRGMKMFPPYEEAIKQ